MTDESSDDGMLAARRAWAAAIGDANVLFDDETRARLDAATYATTQRSRGAIRPIDRAEVQECLRIANRYRIPVYPVSRGRNWGLGSRVAPHDGAVVLDLSRMNRIVDHDEKYGTLTVEPGVTFQQVYEHLAERKSEFMLNVTSGPPDGSLIGNALERGHGVGLYRDRFSHVCAFEVVLPTGEVLNTGFSRHGQDLEIARLHRWGSGPYLEGLFSQSNLGVVTRLTTWLQRTTRARAGVTVYVGTDAARVDRVVSVLQRLSADPRCWFIIHDAARLAYDQEAIRHLKTWTRGEDLGAATGSRRLTELGAWVDRSAAKLYIERNLKRYGDGLICSVALYCNGFLELEGLRREVATALRDAGEKVEHWWPTIGPVATPPTYNRVRAMYAVKRGASARAIGSDVDLDRDRCGVIWVCFATPFDGEHVRRSVSIVKEIGDEYGFQPQLSWFAHGERAFDAFAALVFDRDDPAADRAALECSQKLMDRLGAAGYLQYRLQAQRMSALGEGAPAYAAFLKRIKQTLDPNDILAPGRYDAREHWPAD